MLDKFRISGAKVAKIMDSWLKDAYIICSYDKGNIKNLKKTLCMSSQRKIAKQE